MGFRRGMLRKYGNKRVSHSGYSFASKLEGALFDLLKLRELAGEIRDIKCQQHVKLTDAGIVYIPDFSFIDCATGETTYAEAKGFSTDVFAIKLKLWRYYGPGKLELWKGSYSKLYLAETVIPASY